MMVAPCPASANWPEKNEPNRLGSYPAARSFTLPPVKSGWKPVLTMNWIGFSLSFFTAAIDFIGESCRRRCPRPSGPDRPPEPRCCRHRPPACTHCLAPATHGFRRRVERDRARGWYAAGPEGGLSSASAAASAEAGSLSLASKSGYMVSAPPKDPSSGTWCLFEHPAGKGSARTGNSGSQWDRCSARICSPSSQAYSQASGSRRLRSISVLLIKGSDK